MTDYGDKQEPGIVTSLTSSASVPTSGDAPGDIALVGQADLAGATNAADTSKVYQVTRASKAVEWFGPKDSSLLTTAVIDALNEGAYPVYAVAADSTSVVDEDHSGVTTTGFSIDNAPIREDTDSITVDVDGTEFTVTIIYRKPSNGTPDNEEALINPVTGEVELGTSPSSSLNVSYDHFDYESGIDVVVDKVPDVVDFLAPITENSAVVDDANVTVGNMEGDYNLAIAVGGADTYIHQASNFTQSYDDSRTQVVYPTRFEDGSSAIGAYAGFRAQLGLTETPINKRLTTNKRLMFSPSRAKRGSLNDKGVVPLADESRGVRVTDDPTTVSDSNTDEQNLKYGFNRLVTDYIIQTTRDNQKPFIGKLNSVTVRNTLEGMVNDSLVELQESNAVISHNVNVQKEDAVTAGLEMSVDLAEPLRFIDNTITVGNGG